MSPHPYNFNDSQLGLLITIVLPLVGGLGWIYNAYRMGKLRWKPTHPVNPRLACLVILIGVLMTGVLLAMVD
jgi:hypothetical protein